MRHWLVLSCLALVATGCSGGASPPAQPGDAAPPPASARDGGEAGDAEGDATTVPPPGADSAHGDSAASACNTLANTAHAITTQQVASDPPAPTGGAIADGTYVLTSATIYTGPGGPVGPGGPAQTTLRITGATVEVANAGDPPTRSITLVTSGTAFTSTDTCPDTTVVRGSYSATATTFAVQLDGGTDDAGARMVVETYTLE
jgi:hypothetical protein